MKKMTMISCLFLQTAFAQKTEFSFGVNVTASFFRGADAASTTAIYLSDVPGTIPNTTFKYYGKKAAPGFNAEATVQRVSKKGFLSGISAGYELLSSTVRITELSSRQIVPADGSTKLTHTFINFFPFIGQRFGNKIAVDLNLGVDIALPLSAHEKGEASTNGGGTVSVDIDHDKPAVDLRPRFQLKVQKNHIGLQSSFSAGLINYYGRLNGAHPEAYLNVFRVGVFYVL